LRAISTSRLFAPRSSAMRSIVVTYFIRLASSNCLWIQTLVRTIANLMGDGPSLISVGLGLKFLDLDDHLY
jgi:hypothetical protein